MHHITYKRRKIFVIVMNKKLIIILTSFLLLSGCVSQEPSPNNNDSNTGETTEKTISLPNISLTTKDLNIEMNQVFYNHSKKSYSTENMTGNEKTWFIKKGVFVIFACNSSRIEQSILKFDTKENAELNIELKKQQLLNQNHTETPLNQIANNSWLLQTQIAVNQKIIDVWKLTFSYNEIVVSLTGYASNKTNIIDYAKLIENKIKSEYASIKK